VRLLLDEMFSPSIARELRRRGHDVVAVKERADLIGASDRELARRMSAESRAIVTSDVDDFGELATRFAASGEVHYGMLFTSDRTLPRTRAGIPAIVELLDALLDEHRADDAYRNRTRALP
jgi:predicted nuclease of predicted toxin-antitoxin system